MNLQQFDQEIRFVATARSKPLLRGWLHAGAAVAALPLTFVLCLKSAHDLSRVLTMLIFGFSMVLLYGVSAIYHIFNWHGGWYRLWRTLDHSNIFIFIACSYTAVCFNILSDWPRNLVLGLVWGLSICGVGLNVLDLHVPRWTKTAIYMGTGWVAIIILPVILTVLPWTAVATMMVGGMFYTVGGIIFAWRKPDPFPNIFGFHELFHLFVIAGCAIYVVSIWVWVIPFTNA